jgi:integrase
MQIQSLYRAMTERGLSPRTVRYTHSILRQALAQAVRWRLLATNPADDLALPKQPRQEMRALDPEKAAAFLEAIRGDRWEALWELLIVTGLRPGEALGLRWSDIDLDRNRLSVQRTLVREDDGLRLAEPKTATSRRVVVFPSSTGGTLRAHRARQLKARLKAGDEFDGTLNLVFATHLGRPLDYSNLVSQHFKPIVKATGLEPLRPYDLRHTCATLLLASGEHPKVVAERLGHASTVMTLDAYSHVLPDMQESAADKLELMLFGTTGG